MDLEAVIGLEIHVEMSCATKMFCDCPNRPGDEPNRNVCPVCLWYPGAIPRFSAEALEKAALICLALNCTLQERSAFDQKVYYYPDLPKGFQLSQAHLPLARTGWVEIAGEDGAPRRLRIHKIHMEEDVARLVHEMEGRTPISLVDFNRAGVPLVEIVSEPDLRSPHDAMEFVRTLRTQIRYVGAADCSMESGTMRVDANISLREAGTDALNTKVEVKNMNSVRHVGDAIAYEIERQAACLRAGEEIVLHTRLWDPEKKITAPMRGKFEGPCIPDPSVPMLVLSEAWREEMQSRLPEMPAAKAERFVNRYGIGRDDAVFLCGERDPAEYFEAVVAQGIPPRTTHHWIVAQLVPALRERRTTFTDTTVTATRLARLLAMLERNEINAQAARDVLSRLFETDLDPEAIVEREGMRQVSDAGELECIVAAVLSENPGAVNDYRNGTAKAMGFLIGKAMQASGGKANPKLIGELLREKLRAVAPGG